MSTQSKPRVSITPTPNGPYVVKHLEHLANRHGAIDTRESVALCRCGGSANKPFCDGTHAKNGFSSAKLEGRVEDKREDYRGDGVTIHDNRGICAHAGHCTDGLPSVFRLKQEPWIDPNGASATDIVATVGQCPSGALTYTTEAGEGPPAQEGPATIKVARDGPYEVRGAVEVTDTAFGEGAPRHRFTLCRCGASKNKPFCDGSHWHVKFTDDRN